MPLGWKHSRTLFAISLLNTLSLGVAQAPAATAGAVGKQEAAAKLPEFDAVSIKQHQDRNDGMSWRTTPDGFITVNCTLLNLIGSAYSIRGDLISGGPDWIRSSGFDVTAKVAGPEVEALKKLRGRQRADMLRPMLADRFGVKVHEESKILPLYELVVSKNGPKLKPSPPIPPDPDARPGDPPISRMTMSMGPGEWSGSHMTTGNIADNLAGIVGRTVLNKTGLTGQYEVNLKWSEEHGPANNDAETGPSIFTALQEQLGLRLEPGKGPTETLVIDHVEKPTGN